MLHGFWQKTEGLLVIVSPEGEIAGHIEFFRPVSYWDAFELSYQLYADRYAGRGLVTEAVQLLVDYLFGAARGAFFNDGRNQDVLLYSLLRTDPRPWH